MPWKEPGEKPSEPPRGREPWGRGGRGSDGGNGGGPDLDAWLRRLQRGLGPFGRGPLGIIAVLVAAIVLWFAIGGWSSIGAQQVGVVLRFGRVQAVLQPGLHFRLPPPLDRVRVIDMQRVRSLGDNVRLLTGDGQLVLVDYLVQYNVIDARKYLFAARDAEETARNAATVAMRAEVGTQDLSGLLDHDDAGLSNAVRARLAASIARDDIGIAITGVQIQHVGVPTEVKQAFEGIDKAREDAKAAQASANADVARQQVDTQAQVAAIAAAADAYRDKAAADAQADVARFAQLLPQYQAAPQVTRHRLWLDTMHDVLSRNHVVINSGDGNVIVQFPPRAPAAAADHAPAGSAPATSAPAAAGSVAAPVTSGPALQGNEA